MDAAPDQLLRALSDDGCLAVRVVRGTELVRDTARRHGTGRLATTVLGRSLLGALLLASNGKDGEKVQLRLSGNGPIGPVVSEATCTGSVRGYVSNPAATLPLKRGLLDVSGGIGFGELSVVRHRPGRVRPYTGIVPIVAGEVAQDLALYLTESEQTPAAVGLGVRLAEDGSVASAGGWVALALPGAGDAHITRLEANVAALPTPSDAGTDENAPSRFVSRLLEGIGGRVLETGTPSFACPCSEERVARAVALLGRDEVEAMTEPAEVRCEFCARRYSVPPERVLEQLREASSA